MCDIRLYFYEIMLFFESYKLNLIKFNSAIFNKKMNKINKKLIRAFYLVFSE